MKGSATHREIKAWVKEQCGLFVSLLYITWEKDKYGFANGENFNIDAEGHRLPKCRRKKKKQLCCISVFSMP